jgi:hypothetical protein
MRRLVPPAVALALALAATAAAAGEVASVGPTFSRGECRRMTRQIAHYAEVADRARERGNESWEEHTLQHIARLSERRARLCPEFRERPAGEQLAKMLRDAARIAAKLFMMGMI